MFYDIFWESAESGPSFIGKADIFLSADHIWTLIYSFAAIIIILFLLKRYAGNKTRDVFRITIAAILLIQDIILTIWYATSGVWDWAVTLPLEMSRISVILTFIMLLTKNYTLFEFLFLLSFAGFTQAVATPNLAYKLPHIRFILYFLSHFGMMLGAFYMWIVEGYKPRLKSIGVAMIIICTTASIVGSINYILPLFGVYGSNYMFLARIPDFKSTIDVLANIFGPHPWYIIGLILLALLSYSITYVPFSIYYMIKRNPKPKQEAVFLNILPGFGLGSFLMKSYFRGFIQLIIQLMGIFVYALIFNIAPELITVGLISMIVLLVVGIAYGTISAITYKQANEKENVGVVLENVETNAEYD